MTWRDPGAAITLCGFAAGGFLLLFAFTLVLDRVDTRQLGSVGVWAKPLKFQIATVLHLGTMAWVAAAAWAALTWWLYREALAGRPFLA